METLWLVVLGSIALLVRVGQMLSAVGIARAKNAASAGVRSLADVCVAILCFWALGAAIYFQDNNTFFAVRLNGLIGWSGLSADWFKILVGVLIATGMIAPALSERSRLGVPLAVSALLAAVIVPMIGFWVWGGWLWKRDFADIAGASAIHFAPAVCAAVAAFCVQPREGKYNHDGSSNMIPGHSVSMILLGTMFMLVGWPAYVLMMAPPQLRELGIVGNVMIAAAAGGLASLIVSRIRFGKVDVCLTCSGVVGGLVSITAAAASVNTPAAFVIGAVAGILVPWITVLLDTRCKLDDPGGVIAIHGVGGAWALLAAGLFMPGIPYRDWFKLIGVQISGIVVIFLAAAALSAGLMIILKYTMGLRSPEADEFDGLDLAEHDVNAHPDFQQTMIKSYHLREM